MVNLLNDVSCLKYEKYQNHKDIALEIRHKDHRTSITLNIAHNFTKLYLWKLI